MNADVTALKRLIDQFVDAVNKNDVDLVMECWDENGVQMMPGMPENVGTEKIREYMTESFKQFSWKMSLGEIKDAEVFGKLAFIRLSYTAIMTPRAGGDDIHFDGKDLSISKKQADGTWKVYRDCANSNVPAA
jgi:uncharacterized protein (TIGR02246 family)